MMYCIEFIAENEGVLYTRMCFFRETCAVAVLKIFTHWHLPTVPFRFKDEEEYVTIIILL